MSTDDIATVKQQVKDEEGAAVVKTTLKEAAEHLDDGDLMTSIECCFEILADRWSKTKMEVITECLRYHIVTGIEDGSIFQERGFLAGVPQEMIDHLQKAFQDPIVVDGPEI